ncbi:hypothetical protein [Butyrivibrio fibrisolvens]|uniref:hypothetical protein n=1 Tax=Butyrivibrio fibrisolvens TaxID=831 RepID=UPI000416F2BD|nr:hypothetical protein [Butyrivibrio fibrisolvens]
MDINGFLKKDEYFDVIEDKDQGSAYYSLNIALNSYFSTYQIVKNRLSSETVDPDTINEKVKSLPDFIEASINIWMHLQHFFELEIKRILENKNPLLIVKYSNETDRYCDNVLDIEIKESQFTRNSIEFSEAENRLIYLYKINQIEPEDIDIARILTNHKAELDLINQMRNSTAHRGKRIIKYTVLDELMCTRILPFLNELLELEDYSTYNNMYGSDDKVTDLIKPLIKGEKDEIDYQQIALFKEIARSRPNRNEFGIYGRMSEKDKQTIEQQREIIKIRECDWVEEEFRRCPCCSENALLEVNKEVDREYEEITSDDNEKASIFPNPIPVLGLDRLCCANCGFYVNTFVGDLHEIEKLEFELPSHEEEELNDILEAEAYNKFLEEKYGL